MAESDWELGTSRRLVDSIRRIARHGVIDPATGATYAGGMVHGFVAKVRTEESDPLRGTVDVKEFNAMWGAPGEYEAEGYHKGVRLGAIQRMERDVVLVPKLYSDVVVQRSAADGREYVVMFSQVDAVRLDAFEEAVIGVTGREELKEDDGSPDIGDLPETGEKSSTRYAKDGAVTEATDGKGTESLAVRPGGVWIGTEENGATSHAVLGEELADLLSQTLNCIAQIKTATQLGPQPPLNAAQFVSLKAKVDAWKGALSGFISPKVNVQRK